MRKIYLTGLLLAFTTATFAQKSTGTVPQQVHKTPSVNSMTQTKAFGDTLFFFDGINFYITDPADENDFDFRNVDIDMLTPSVSSFDSDFMTFYSVETYDLLPGDVDTAFYLGASSWFSPPGQADNWFTFGPITVPATGADLKWYNKSNPAWTDGYSVYISTTGLEPYTDVDPGTDTPVYTKEALQPPATQPASDSVFTPQNVNLNQYAGSRVYVFFHHNTNDGDIFYLDHITLTESNGTPGYAENQKEMSVKLFPNPAKTFLNVSIHTVGNRTDAMVTISDITGKVIDVVNYGQLHSGVNTYHYSTENLTNGLYFFTIHSGTETVTSKVSVIK